MATPTPKSMSSRLLTMKFMQRAAAFPSSSPTAPDTDEQASKRRKVTHKPTAHENKDPAVQINQAAVQAAIAEEERKRQEALVKHAAELGDARWVLDIPDKAAGPGHAIQTPLNVVQVGFAQIDSQIDSFDATGLDAESTDNSHIRAPMASKPNATKNDESQSESDSDSSESDSESDSDASSQEYGPGRDSNGQRPETQSDSPRSVLRRKRSAEQERAKQFAEKRRMKEVKLNSPKPSPNSGGLLSISSGGGTPTRPTCFRCGKPGHKGAECKNAPKRSAR
ncbi:metalloprotease [Hypoxylon texense]